MGSIGGGKSKSESTPVPVNTWTEEQKAAMKALWEKIGPGLEGPVPSYPGQMYVPKTPEEEAYFQSVSSGRGARETALNTLLSGKSAYEINPETTEELYQRGIRAPALKEFQDITLPQIKSSFMGPGYYGSARALTETKAAENLATTLAAERAKLAYADETARRAGLESGATRAAQYGLPAATMESQIMTGPAERSRAIEQEKVLSDLQRWLMGETVEGTVPTQYNPYLQLAMQLLGFNPLAVGTQSSSNAFNANVSVGGTAPGLR